MVKPSKKPQMKTKWTSLSQERRLNSKGDITTLEAGRYGKLEGISLKRKGVNKEGKEYKKAKFWIPSEMDVGSWLSWICSNIRDIFEAVWKKKVVIVDSEKINEKISELNNELKDKETEFTKIQTELQEYRSLKENINQKKELAGKLPNNSKEYEEKFNELKTNYIEHSYNNDIAYEDKVKEFLVNNKWILGLDCEFCEKNINIDQQTQLDLHVINSFGHNKIFEFKSPNLPPFDYTKENKHKRLKASRQLLEGLDEIITYVKRTKLNAELSSQGGLKILEPTGIIVIGFNLNSEQISLLETWNTFLYPHIRIITYNSLLSKAKQELELIKKVKSSKNK